MTRKLTTWTLLLVCLAIGQAAHAQKNVAPTLPVLTEGPWAGKHAAFYTYNFHAVVNPDASLSVYFKAYRTLQADAPPVTFRLVTFYREADGAFGHHRATTRYRRIKSFTKVSDPQEFNKKRSIKIEGTLDGDIPFQIVYSFNKNEVRVSGGVDDVHNPYPSYPTFRVEMPAGVGEPIDYSRLGELVGDYHVDTMRFDGGAFPWDKFTYLDTPSLNYAVYRTKVWGQWGPRVLNFETKHTGGIKGFGEGHNRVELPLWRGYNLWLDLRSDSVTSKGREIVLQVD